MTVDQATLQPSRRSPHALTRMVVALAAAGALVLVACSSAGSPVPPSAGAAPSASGPTARAAPSRDDTPSACALITPQEVATVLGNHSTNDGNYVASASDVGPPGTCTYSWTSQGGHGEFTVSVFPTSSYIKDPSGPEPRTIEGIGDKAFEIDGNFYAQVGGQMIHIVNVQEGPGADEALLSIAAHRMAD